MAVTEQMKTKPTGIKKRRGVFYTPPELSGLLADWAVRSPRDRALEPSFGGCNFLASLQHRFNQLGSTRPWERIFGCDIESSAFTKYLTKLIPNEFDRRNFLKADFLTLTPNSFDGKLFQAALGNPPYVSNHNMFKSQRAAAIRVGFNDTFRLRLTGNLWSHFVFHSIRFLAPGGRMAWVLPSSILQAQYGRTLLDELRQRFGRVAIISLEKKVFDDTTENSEILLCDGYGRSANAFVDVANAKTLAACATLLRGWNSPPSRFLSLTNRAVPSLISRRRLVAFRRIARSPQTVSLAARARLSIGVVTGANNIFVVSADTAQAHKLPNGVLTPILAKFDIARGLTIRQADFRVAIKSGVRCLLVDASGGKIPRTVIQYFARIPIKTRNQNVTFAKRTDWRIPDAGAIPGGFIGYMHHTGPRLILNSCRVNSTNTVHRVYFDSKVTNPQRRLLAICMLSTFSQLSAEIEGRTYGSGVLKHELREAGSIQLLIPPTVSDRQINTRFRTIDRLLRSGKSAAAQTAADRFLSSHFPALVSNLALIEMRDDLNYLRQRRHKQK